MEKTSKRILLTGGHAASSAFVVVEEIRRQKKPWTVYWIGFGKSLEGENVSTLSSLYFPKYGIKTYNLITGRLQRRWTVNTIPSLLKIPFGFIHSFWLLLKIRPDLILSFGGFSSFPVVVVGYIMRIPIILHEQTSVVGRANKYSSYFVKKIAISKKSSRKYFPRNKTVLVGNPIPKLILGLKKNKIIPKVPTIMITGGQSGAVSINRVVVKALPVLLKRYRIIHLTGLKDVAKYKKKKNRLSTNLRKHYTIYGLVDPKKFDELFNSSDIIISRAGANNVAKIVFAGKPSVLIPYPYSYLNEQLKNVQYAARNVGAIVVEQKYLNKIRLISKVDYLKNNWKRISKDINNNENRDVKAAERIVLLIKKYMK